MRATCTVAALVSAAVVSIGGSALVAQNALVELGLTETTARNFILEEIKSPATDRRSAIAIAGTRAFLKLPSSARGPVAASLFTWAKSYLNSATFRATYAKFRKDRIPSTKQYALTVEEALKKDIDDQLAGLEQLRQAAASMSQADRAKVLDSVKEMQRRLTDPAMLKMMREQLAAERAQEGGRDAALVQQVDETLPADPQKLVARRLREFLRATADVNFSARTISLTGGADGIEFVDRADRTQSAIWQEAVIAGREATTAARAAAETWLKEIER